MYGDVYKIIFNFFVDWRGGVYFGVLKFHIQVKTFKAYNF